MYFRVACDLVCGRISGGTVRWRTDHVERMMIPVQLQTISMVERMFGGLTNPLGVVRGKVQLGAKSSISVVLGRAEGSLAKST